ncbi:hypothetical protein GGC65_003992 [Sphingopyxis sp. OAS728]|uniref:hypothetical protein n=1 Tax=Sphingopyxis sp. OAS728 TaxID=2663823 RepID=UPI001789FA54|nr:hypothetical protein [Sphingopyxis sp. OAS728]MBE1529536.1 hypothetical protein [Sphingopyxis sp. OAS728]
MSHTVFIAVQGNDRLVEVDLPGNASIEFVRASIKEAGIEIDGEFILFLDEDDDPIEWLGDKRPHHIKHGAKLHLAKCRKIDVTIHYLEQTKRHSFAPGTRIRRVKAWAVDRFKLAERDAAEHVLQVCGSTDRPPTDTPLHKLVNHGHCELCFDLVPDVRVEG